VAPMTDITEDHNPLRIQLRGCGDGLHARLVQRNVTYYPGARRPSPGLHQADLDLLNAHELSRRRATAAWMVRSASYSGRRG
jgi:hypothetical protein